MLIVDAHTHLGLAEFIVKPIPAEKLAKPAFQDKTTQRVEELLSSMDRNSVSRAVVFPFPLAEADADLANGYVLEAWKRYPDRIIPFALLDEKPEYWIDKGFRGFKQHFLLEPERFDLSKAYPAIAASGKPLMAHFPTYKIVESAEAILSQAPDIKLIIAHFGRCKPNTGACVTENLEALKKYPNVYFESSTVMDSEVLAGALEIVGPERICFGSDLPFGSKESPNPQGVEIEVIKKAFKGEKNQKQIFSKTILKLLGEE